jgi:hypothetical protein
MDASIGPDKNPLQGSFKVVDIQTPVLDGSQVRWKVKASQFVQTAWDSSQLIKLIAGQTPAAATKNLEGFPGLVSPPQITLTPAWWPVLPLLPARIEVDVR